MLKSVELSIKINVEENYTIIEDKKRPYIYERIDSVNNKTIKKSLNTLMEKLDGEVINSVNDRLVYFRVVSNSTYEDFYLLDKTININELKAFLNKVKNGHAYLNDFLNYFNGKKISTSHSEDIVSFNNAVYLTKHTDYISIIFDNITGDYKLSRVYNNI